MPSGRKIPINLPPGVVLNRTEYESQGRYIDCDHVRFSEGRPEKIGGWEQWNETGDELEGVCRSILCWQDYSYNVWHVFGTSSRLYVFNQDKTRANITPLEASGNLTDPFTTSNGSRLVRVDHTAHGVENGQVVRYSGATAVGGITIDGEYTVHSVIDANAYRVRAATAASSGGTGGGTVAYEYEISAGSVDVYSGGGYGLGTYGSGTYGTARSSVTYTQLPRLWSLDRYGQNLLAMPSGGTVYLWERDTADPAEALANAPTTGLYMFVTSERIIVVLGADGDFMTMKWCDDDDPTNWTPADDNTANTRKLQEGSRLVAGGRMAQGVNMVWTDTAAYLMQFTGTNAVYSTRIVGTNCGLIGPTAFACVDGVAFWMSARDFHMYSGALQTIPNSSDISTIFDDLESSQRFKVMCFFNPDYREIWWLYPSAGATEPDHYVAVSLDDYSWTIGTLERTAFGVRTLVGENLVLATDESGTIYQHETGVDADGAALAWNLDTAYFDLENGNSGLNIDGYIPDFKRRVGEINLRWSTLDMPADSSFLENVATTMAEDDTIVDLRHFGRQAKFRLAQSVIGGDFRLGQQRIEVSGTRTKREK